MRAVKHPTLITSSLAVAGLVLFAKPKRMATWFCALMLAGGLLTSGLIAWTANLGGQVRHSEIRPPEGLAE